MACGGSVLAHHIQEQLARTLIGTSGEVGGINNWTIISDFILFPAITFCGRTINYGLGHSPKGD